MFFLRLICQTSFPNNGCIEARHGQGLRPCYVLIGLETQIIALISLEQYLANCRPLHYHRILNKLTYISVISLVAAVTCGFTIFSPLAGIGSEMSTEMYICMIKHVNVTGYIYFGSFAVVGCGLSISIVTVANV